MCSTGTKINLYHLFNVNYRRQNTISIEIATVFKRSTVKLGKLRQLH
jgi:hypothetical protein